MTGRISNRTDGRIGNQFWKARSSHGRKPIFANAEILHKMCIEYFEWVEAHPLYESKPFQFKGSIIIAEMPKMRAMTISGLCLFLDIEPPTWRDYKSQKAFSFVCAKVEETIRTQKFEGASADLLNPAIIARDLGLADRTEITGKNQGPVEIEYTNEDRARALKKFILQTMKKQHSHE